MSLSEITLYQLNDRINLQQQILYNHTTQIDELKVALSDAAKEFRNEVKLLNSGFNKMMISSQRFAIGVLFTVIIQVCLIVFAFVLNKGG